MSGKKIKIDGEHILSDKQVDICPSCKPAPRMMATAALSRAEVP